MRHIIISDTHSNQCIEKAKKRAKKLIKKHPDIDTIVINGDLLGIFSMEKSTIHKEKGVTKDDLKEYLQEAAPNFYNKYVTASNLGESLIMEYVKERYEWCTKILQEFSKIQFTLFNMGNHESPLHFLVLEELEYLTEQKIEVSEEGREKLNRIYDDFENTLIEMENTHSFRYISNEPHIYEKYLIIGIPGVSHSTHGNDYHSQKQEEKTKEIIEKAKEIIHKAGSIIIYNHTQGNYSHNNGSFESASPSLKKFMQELPGNIYQKIFVQSHNHWAHTQFLKHNDFHYVLNNAGLHDGIFNIISFNTMEVNCYDVDPNEEEYIKLQLAHISDETIDETKKILRNYSDETIVLRRKKQENAIGRKETTKTVVLSASEILNLKKKVFGDIK